MPRPHRYLRAIWIVVLCIVLVVRRILALTAGRLMIGLLMPTSFQGSFTPCLCRRYSLLFGRQPISYTSPPTVIILMNCQMSRELKLQMAAAATKTVANDQITIDKWKVAVYHGMLGSAYLGG